RKSRRSRPIFCGYPLCYTIPPMTTFSPEIDSAIKDIETIKGGLIPPFLTRRELDDCLSAWHRLWDDPTVVRMPNPVTRFIVDNRMYREPAFAKVATHPVVQAAARATLGPDVMLINYAVVATPPYSKEPSKWGEIPFHIDHCVFSDVPLPEARDTMV